MARSRLVIAVVLAVVIIIILAAAAAFYLSQPPGGPAGSGCSGTASYSGTVSNATGVPVPGVVVVLTVAAPNSGTNTSATTGANGAWSATLSGVCAYNARYFWQSATSGPRLASASNLAKSSTRTVNVSWATVDLDLLSEFSHDGNATIAVTIPAGLSFFVDANATGSIAAGFLPTDDAGNPGYNFTTTAMITANGTAPFALVYTNATAFAVQDENGNSVVYAKPSANGAFGIGNATDALNMTAAIAEVLAAGGIPYIQVGGRGSLTTPYNVTNATHALVGNVGTFFGSSLWDYVTVRTNSTLYLSVALTLRNTQNRNACWAVDPQGSSVHAWYYGIGNCP